MKITREKPCHRRHHRVKTPLCLRIDGVEYSATDWSLGGFRLENWLREDLLPGDSLKCNFKLPFQGFDIAFDVEAIVVRRCVESNELAAQFTELSDRQIELLSHFIEELIRGSMTPVADTILRIDSPVTPVSTQPDPSPRQELPAKRWPIRLVVMSGLYFSLGMALFLFILFTLYANFMSLEVDSGVVVAPIERILSTTDGRISRVSVGTDYFVAAGTSLITIEDARVEQQISVAQINIERNRALLNAKREELAIEREKISDYRRFVRHEIAETNTRIRTWKKQKNLAAKDVARHTQLVEQDLVSRHELEKYVRSYNLVINDLELAVIALKKLQETIEVLENGHYFTGDRMEGNVKQLRTEVDRLKQEVTFDTQELVALYQRRERLTVNAPTSGRVLEFLKSSGSSTRRGETIALFERDDQRVIEVYLTQQEVLSVRLHQSARAYFPAIDSAADAQVVKIDRSAGFLDEEKARYNRNAGNDRTAKVTLAFSSLSNDLLRQQFKPGLPAIVLFPNIGTGKIGDWIRSFRSHTQVHMNTNERGVHSAGGTANAI